MDRAVHTTATEQTGIGRVHDHVDVGLGDVTANSPQLHVTTVGSRP
jgi:hypothetical protein